MGGGFLTLKLILEAGGWMELCVVQNHHKGTSNGRRLKLNVNFARRGEEVAHTSRGMEENSLINGQINLEGVGRGVEVVLTSLVEIGGFAVAIIMVPVLKANILDALRALARHTRSRCVECQALHGGCSRDKTASCRDVPCGAIINRDHLLFDFPRYTCTGVGLLHLNVATNC